MSCTSSIGGFTLIELLVIIAILGIVFSVMLSSLEVARQKGLQATGASTTPQELLLDWLNINKSDKPDNSYEVCNYKGCKTIK